MGFFDFSHTFSNEVSLEVDFRSLPESEEEAGLITNILATTKTKPIKRQLVHPASILSPLCVL